MLKILIVFYQKGNLFLLCALLQMRYVTKLRKTILIC